MSEATAQADTAAQAVQRARSIATSVAAIDWAAVEDELDAFGFAVTEPLLEPEECAEVIELFDQLEVFRSSVVMARHGYGEGIYRYFADPLVPLVHELRTHLYERLAPIANHWGAHLEERQFPRNLPALLAECAGAGQLRPTPLLLRYGTGGYNCLHQDVYGDITFPLQVAIMLNDPDRDFTGGESIFVEQRPRAQSRGMVARPRLGQGLVFPVHHRPVPGVRGFRRVAMRHGVSRVRSGRRHVLGIIFHNAQ
jgi:hypothetical protein